MDDIEVATEFYRTVLGFEQAANADGPMDYPGVDLASFARDAGFDDGRVSLDVRFLKHPEVGVYLELFTYHHPKGDQTIHRRKTNDLGGIRHVAVEVPDAVAAYTFIRFQQQAARAETLAREADEATKLAQQTKNAAALTVKEAAPLTAALRKLELARTSRRCRARGRREGARRRQDRACLFSCCGS